jgi:hypothetical protein
MTTGRYRAAIVAMITASSLCAQALAPLPINMNGKWTFLGKRTSSDVMSVVIDGDGAPGKITGRLTLRANNCGALDEPFQGTWDGTTLRFDALLRSNVNTQRSNMDCPSDATKFVLARKPGQAGFEGEASASTGTFQVTLAP